MGSGLSVAGGAVGDIVAVGRLGLVGSLVAVEGGRLVGTGVSVEAKSKASVGDRGAEDVAGTGVVA